MSNKYIEQHYEHGEAHKNLLHVTKHEFSYHAWKHSSDFNTFIVILVTCHFTFEARKLLVPGKLKFKIRKW